MQGVLIQRFLPHIRYCSWAIATIRHAYVQGVLIQRFLPHIRYCSWAIATIRHAYVQGVLIQRFVAAQTILQLGNRQHSTCLCTRNRDTDVRRMGRILVISGVVKFPKTDICYDLPKTIVLSLPNILSLLLSIYPLLSPCKMNLNLLRWQVAFPVDILPELPVRINQYPVRHCSVSRIL